MREAIIERLKERLDEANARAGELASILAKVEIGLNRIPEELRNDPFVVKYREAFKQIKENLDDFFTNTYSGDINWLLNEFNAEIVGVRLEK